ncbi:MAG: TraB/GumN family protein [Bacteroidota bacterium]|nr:TraB/GumN family protein [Bacteroidota bacterium]
MRKLLFISLFLLFTVNSFSQITKQKGLLWQITGNGLKKPSYVYGTMHVSSKIAFHLGDSFYIALAKSDIVALEQNLDSVIYKWISKNEDEDLEDINKVAKKDMYAFLNLYDFTLNNYNKKMIARKLSEEAREVNYLLKRGEQGNFEEDAWLDLYIYQLAKKMGKHFTGVEGYEESRDLVKKSQKEPKDSKFKPKKFNYSLRQQIADAYRKGDIYMLDSIDRMTESEHYLEYMLYKRNANMVRRMDSIMKLNKILFTGVGCAHLPGEKGVLNMLIKMGYQVRPVQSIAKEKSKLAKKFEEREYKHVIETQISEDGLISAGLPGKLTKVRDNSFYSTYLSPDLANSHYYQIDKVKSNGVFSSKATDVILEEIDTLIFENIPGEILSKKNVLTNGMKGLEIVTKLKTGDLNRFQILASPFNIYIIRLSAKKKYAVSKEADDFFKTLKINEGADLTWRRMNSPDSLFSVELPATKLSDKFTQIDKSNPSYEYLAYDKQSLHTFLIKQEEIINQSYLEEDSFELNVMSKGFAYTDNFNIISKRHHQWQGYNALDVVYKNSVKNSIYARFIISGNRYLMFVLKPQSPIDFNHPFFNTIQFNKQSNYKFFEYADTTLFFKVKTSVVPSFVKKDKEEEMYYYDDEEDEEEDLTIDNKYKGKFSEVYFVPKVGNEFVAVKSYRYGYYESQRKTPKEYFDAWKKNASLLVESKQEYIKKGVKYVLYTYTDTNSTKKIKVLNTLHGNKRYYVEAYIDGVSGKSDFVDSFLNSFDVSDSIAKGDIFEKKGHLFIKDFAGKDSLARRAAIKNLEDVEFTKKDFLSLCHIIDTISMKGSGAGIRTYLIYKLSAIDSSSDLTIPYLQKLYKRFSDTAYLQIEILKAIAKQKNQMAYQAIKPILENDFPISDSKYEMENMLFAFSDSLKLTKTILNELIELTNIVEYRNAAYSILSRMKDSGIINEKDYSNIHQRLVFETKIEYKRMMATITKDKKESYSSYNDYYDISTSAYNFPSRSKSSKTYYSSGSSSLLSKVLDLSLPLYAKQKELQDIVSRILKITNNPKRLVLMPVLLKHQIHFDDTVYYALAKNKETRSKLYSILAEAKMLNKFPAEFLNQKDFVVSQLYANAGTYNKIDTFEFISKFKLVLGKDTGVIFAFKFNYDDEVNSRLFLSTSQPTDTSKLNTINSKILFLSESQMLSTSVPISKVIEEILFETEMAYRRTTNGGYFNTYANSRKYKQSSNTYSMF